MCKGLNFEIRIFRIGFLIVISLCPLTHDYILLINYVSGSYVCNTCGRMYKVARSLWRHEKYECQKEPAFKCIKCSYKAKHKSSVMKHIITVHRTTDIEMYRNAL